MSNPVAKRGVHSRSKDDSKDDANDDDGQKHDCIRPFG